MTGNLALARRLTDAWNQSDVATVLALVAPDVEFETPGGVDRRPEAARRWIAKQTQPHATMHIVVDQLLEAGDRVVVFSRRQMRWRETGELADETPGACPDDVSCGQAAPLANASRPRAGPPSRRAQVR